MQNQEGQMSLFAQDTWSGKMSQAHCQVQEKNTQEKTLRQSLKKQSELSNRKPPLFLYLRKDGPQQDASWETIGALPGEYLTHSFGESPSAAVESHLSQILEDNPHQRFSLSAKACMGILNRASSRGKKLPEPLAKALVEQSLALSKSEADAMGGGKGALIQKDKSATLSTLQDQTLFQPLCIEMTSTKNTIVNDGIVPTLTARMGTGGNQVNAVLDKIVLDDQGGQQINVRTDGKIPTLRAETHGNLPCVMEQTTCLDVGWLNSYTESAPTLLARGYKDPHLICKNKYSVRRLTPCECERLQGFPDGWTLIGDPVEKVVEDFDPETGEKEGEHIEHEFFYTNSKGKRVKCADSARYKALGNSIAIPPWKWVLKRLCACYEWDATMASLFDGIGGFPYIWEQLNGKGSCLWASEIEEFPMAVTKVRFP